MMIIMECRANKGKHRYHLGEIPKIRIPLGLSVGSVRILLLNLPCAQLMLSLQLDICPQVLNRLLEWGSLAVVLFTDRTENGPDRTRNRQ